MMKIPIVLCGILCASTVHSLYHPVEQSTELREQYNALLNMTIAHITTIYGQYISWVEDIARAHKDGTSAARHIQANRHYVSYIRTTLSSRIELENIKKIKHVNYPECHRQEEIVLHKIPSHHRELQECFEMSYSYIASNEEPMKKTKRMILDKLNKLRKELNRCSPRTGTKSTDDFFNCINSFTDDIVLLYQFSIRDNVELKIDGQTMSMPPRADLDVNSCYNKIDDKFQDDLIPSYEHASRCYEDKIRN